MSPRLRSFLMALSLASTLPCVLSAQTELMREQIFRRLERGYKLLEEDKFAEARQVFETMTSMDLNSTETAQLFQLLGAVQVSLNDYAGAVDSYDRAIAAKALPPEVTKRLTRSLITLTAQLERWEDCLRRLRAYLSTESSPSVEYYTIGSSAASQLGLYDEALGYILQAIRMSPEPKEAYYQSWAGFLFELKRLPEVAEVLEIMIRLFPDRDGYWKQLSSLYLQLEQEEKALAIMSIAYQRGFLRTEGELRQLANLYLFLEIPHAAAQILEKGLTSGAIERNFRNLDSLARSWMAARETAKAIAAFEDSAKLAENGETYYRLGQLRIEAEEWGEAERDLLLALERGGLANTGNAWIMLGYAQFNAHKFDEALVSFEKAEQFSASQGTARQWIGHVRDELAQREAERALRESAAAPATAVPAQG